MRTPPHAWFELIQCPSNIVTECLQHAGAKPGGLGTPGFGRMSQQGIRAPLPRLKLTGDSQECSIAAKKQERGAANKPQAPRPPAEAKTHVKSRAWLPSSSCS